MGEKKMSISLGKKFRQGLLCAALLLLPGWMNAAETPIQGGGAVGLGVEFGGDPWALGLSGKIWLDRQNAFQPTIKFNSTAGFLQLPFFQLDYLWHFYGLLQPDEGSMPVYFGVGAGFYPYSSSLAEIRGPLGISYLFDRKEIPMDIYLQVTPTLLFNGYGSSIQVYANLGARYYF